MDLNQKIPHRAALLLLAVVCYFVTVVLLAYFPDLDQEQTWSAFEWLVGTLGAGVLGMTVRPSGQRSSSFNVTQPGVESEADTSKA